MGRGTNELKLMMDIGIDIILSVVVVVVALAEASDVDEDKKRLLDCENRFVWVVAGTGFGGATGSAACVVGLEVLAEVIVFLIAPIAAAPAADALTCTFEAVIFGKSFCGTGLDWVTTAGEQLWSAGNRCEGQNWSLHLSHRIGEKRTFLQPPFAQTGIVLALPDFPVMTKQS